MGHQADNKNIPVFLTIVVKIFRLKLFSALFADQDMETTNSCMVA